MKILLVIVDYNSNEYTRKLISSFPVDVDCEFLVVCTGSAIFNSDRSNVKVIDVENLGYFPAASLALKDVEIQLYDFIIISNSDIEIISFPSHVLKELQKNQTLGLIGPSIVNLQGVQQNPFLIDRIGPSRKLFWRVYYSNYYVSILITLFRKRFQKKKTPSNVSLDQEVYSVHGAFMIFTKVFFEKGCKIKDDFFLYAEELSSAEECRRANLSVQVVSDLMVKHKENVSTGKLNSKKKWLVQREAYFTVIKNYFKT